MLFCALLIQRNPCIAREFVCYTADDCPQTRKAIVASGDTKLSPKHAPSCSPCQKRRLQGCTFLNIYSVPSKFKPKRHMLLPSDSSHTGSLTRGRKKERESRRSRRTGSSGCGCCQQAGGNKRCGGVVVSFGPVCRSFHFFYRYRVPRMEIPGFSPQLLFILHRIQCSGRGFATMCF